MSVLVLISQQAIHHQSHHVLANMEEAQGGNGAGVFISRAQDAHNQCNLEKQPDGLR